MEAIRRIWPCAQGLVYAVDEPGDSPVDVYLDGRRVWSFRQADRQVPPEAVPAEPIEGVLGFEPWPAALRPHLRGTFRVAARTVPAAGAPPPLPDGLAGVPFSLDGDPSPLRLVDRTGRPLVVNKWGRLGHTIADASPGMVERMLDSMDGIRDLLRRQLGDRVYVTGGTLLGPVREGGHLLPHDDDADLSYLSERSAPADVALESFEIGRLLREAGYEVVRLSVGHLQVLFDHGGVPDHYVDVFPGFLLEGYWYQHFGVREQATADQLLPPTTVLVEGRPEPAPRDPDRMLRAIYGPGWRVPDPAFTFDIPPGTGDRFYGWFADYNAEREDWDDEVLLAPADVRPGNTASSFARWVDDRTPAGHRLLDLGCGVGTDALALGASGRTVHAVDYSRHAVAVARAALVGRDVDVTVEVLNLLDTRAVIRLGAELASTPAAWTVMGRRLLNALEDRGRDNVMRLCGMLLRRGGVAHLDLVADHGYPGVPAHRHLHLQQVVDEAGRHGLVLEEAVRSTEPVTWFGAPEEHLVEMWRTIFRRRSR